MRLCRFIHTFILINVILRNMMKMATSDQNLAIFSLRTTKVCHYIEIWRSNERYCVNMIRSITLGEQWQELLPWRLKGYPPPPPRKTCPKESDAGTGTANPDEVFEDPNINVNQTWTWFTVGLFHQQHSGHFPAEYVVHLWLKTCTSARFFLVATQPQQTNQSNRSTGNRVIA